MKKNGFYADFLGKYGIYLFIFFISSFFFLPTKWLRNYYYLVLVIPFLPIMIVNGYRNFLESRILQLSFLYCTYLILSLFWANEIGIQDSLDYIRKSFLVLVFLTITTHLLATEWDRVLILFRYLCWTAGTMAVISFVWYGILFYEDLAGNGYRLINIGTLNFPLTAANAYGMVVVIACFNFFFSDGYSLKEKIPYLLVIFASVTFIFMTKSRGPLLALAAVLTFGTLFQHPKKSIWLLGFFSISFFAAIESGVFQLSHLTERGDSFRFTIWQQSWEIFKNNPILGYGLGGVRPPILYAHGEAAHSHNLVLSNLLDGGIVAALLLAGILTVAIIRASRFYFVEKKIVLLALILFSFFANLTDGKVLIVSPNHQWLYFWLPVGIVAAYEIREKNQKSI